MNKTIDLTINKEGLAHNIQKAKENNIIIPTIAQMQRAFLDAQAGILAGSLQAGIPCPVSCLKTFEK